MRKYLIRLLVRWFIKENREITKLTIGEEFNLFRMTNPNDITKLLKSFMTAQTSWYWEAKTDKERDIAKGAAMMLKILTDGHQTAMNIIEMESEEDKQYQMWSKYKKGRKGFKVN